MKSLAIILLVSVAIANCKSVINQTEIEKRVIGGKSVDRKDVAYMVSLKIEFVGPSGFCGGSLISTNYVLTAANCFRGRTDVTALALIGVTDLFDLRGEEIRSRAVSIHPQFDPTSFANDIALVELQRHVVLSETIQTVPLPLRRDLGRSFNNFPVITAGWGVVEDVTNSPIPARHLSAVRSTVISNLACTIRYPIFITENSICTNAEVEIGTPCRGDEGGPLVVESADPAQRIQVGIFSFQFSLGCARGWPAVFTRTSRYISWIAQVTGLNLP